MKNGKSEIYDRISNSEKKRNNGPDYLTNPLEFVNMDFKDTVLTAELNVISSEYIQFTCNCNLLTNCNLKLGVVGS